MLSTLNWRSALLRCLPEAWRLRLYTDTRSVQVAQALLQGLQVPTDPLAVNGLARALQSTPSAVDAELARLRASPAQALTDLVDASQRLQPAPGCTVISLGTHCFTSALLRRWGLRAWSGPFDWLFSSAAMVAHCIEDDFRLLLDPSQYEPVPIAERAAGPTANRVQHRYYRDVLGVEHVFNHHDVHLPEDHAHFVRAVERFRAALASDGPKLFVMHRWHVSTSLDQLEPLRQVLAGRSRNYRLVVVSVRESLRPAWPQATVEAVHSDLVAYTFDPVSRWAPLEFPDTIDEQFLVHLLRHEAQNLLGGPGQPGEPHAPAPVTPT
jgi:hypothetical protein